MFQNYLDVCNKLSGRWIFSGVSQKTYVLTNQEFQASICRRNTFVNKDILDFNLPDVDVYFFAGTCFSNETLDHIKNQLSDKTHHFYILSTSKPFEEDTYTIVNYFYVPCTWGSTTLYLQEHKAELGT